MHVIDFGKACISNWTKIKFQKVKLGQEILDKIAVQNFLFQKKTCDVTKTCPQPTNNPASIEATQSFLKGKIGYLKFFPTRNIKSEASSTLQMQQQLWRSRKMGHFGQFLRSAGSAFSGD